MRLAFNAFVGLAVLVAPEAASAATIIVYKDPMTMERHTVVVDRNGPDRAYLCMLPPSVAGCQPVPIERIRR